MSFFRRLFGIPEPLLPCKGWTGYCPYEYALDPDRDIEGMPFIDDDPRSCPDYGHICPKFMEDFGLTEGELALRAGIHCGLVAFAHLKKLRNDPQEEAYLKAIKTHDDIVQKYPEDKFPHLYIFDGKKLAVK